MWNQFSFAQIPINDQSLILRQQNICTSIHPYSEWSKVPLEKLHANNRVEVGNIVYLYSDRIVVVVENMWCKIRKFLKGSQLRSTSYRLGLYKVPSFSNDIIKYHPSTTFFYETEKLFLFVTQTLLVQKIHRQCTLLKKKGWRQYVYWSKL